MCFSRGNSGVTLEKNSPSFNEKPQHYAGVVRVGLLNATPASLLVARGAVWPVCVACSMPRQCHCLSPVVACRLSCVYIVHMGHGRLRLCVSPGGVRHCGRTCRMAGKLSCDASGGATCWPVSTAHSTPLARLRQWRQAKFLQEGIVLVGCLPNRGFDCHQIAMRRREVDLHLGLGGAHVS